MLISDCANAGSKGLVINIASRARFVQDCKAHTAASGEISFHSLQAVIPSV